MSLLLATALSASAATLPVCSWDRPGANPFMGSVVDAVDRYSDIPAPVRAALKKRMGERQYDDVAVIRRDTVEGKFRYSPEIREMHFGQGQVCRTVTRAQWKPAAEERGLIYCESGHCIIVPTVCRNVSRVTRLAPDRAAGAAADGPAAEAASPSAGAATTAADVDELQFEAPGAGQSFAQQANPSQPTRVATALPGIDSGGELPLAGTGDRLGGGFNPGAIDTGGRSRGGGGGGLPAGGTDFGGNGPGSPAPPAPPPEGPLDLPVVLSPLDPTTPLGPPLPFPVELPSGPVPAVPEPATWALWLLGLAALARAARRRQPVVRP